ncbi:MAG TPA: hypothetical protein VI229_00165 [Burkholderiales bacterium]
MDLFAPTDSEDFRHACEVKMLSRWTRAHRLAYIEGDDGAPGVRQLRGDAAADRLLADLGETR